jgi:4-hydroxybenzoate polyprenyltransferase/phosphoserine phosphatase
MESADKSKTIQQFVANEQEPPLCVDLDGTLVRTDLLYESVLKLVATRPLALLQLSSQLLKGKAAFKNRLAELVSPDPGCLPYNQSVLEFLRQQRSSGRTLVLATASHQIYADAVAEHLQLFDLTIGSNGSANRRGLEKVAAIQSEVGMTFDYMGDSDADLPLVVACRRVHLVNPSHRLRKTGIELGKVDSIFEDSVGLAGRARSLLKLLRPHQWAKNALVFVPMLAGHQWDGITFGMSCLAFAAFSATASSIYIVNDLLDLESDRKHHSKHRRPIASTAVPIPTAVLVAGVLLILGLGLASATGWLFLLWTLLYVAITTAYSVILKKLFLVDVLTLGWLYTHRVLAGSIATGIALSHWLIGFSSFLFISLALAKRHAELAATEGEANQRRGYRAEDLPLLANIGPTTGLMAVLILGLYINGEMAEQLYRQSAFLWLLVPILMYWVLRVWFLAVRGELDEDPIVFAIKDQISYLCLILCGLVVLLAI